MSEQYVVGIDSGTQSTKAIVFDRMGEVVSVGSAKHEPYFSLQKGWAEQSPEDTWSKFCLACREAMAKLDAPKEQVIAAGLTAQRNTFVFTDGSGQPLRPLILWLDERLAEGIELITDQEAWVPYWQLRSKANWVKINEPEVHRRIQRVLTVTGWLTHRLTGNFNDALGMHCGWWPIDMERLSLPETSALYHATGIPREKLANVFKPGEILGCVTPQAAEETGLPAGLPIVATSGDKQCEALGSGSILPGHATISYGTLAGLVATSYKPVKPPDASYTVYPSAVPGGWHLEFQVIRGYWLVTWFLEQFGAAEFTQAAKRAVPVGEILREEAARIPPGSDGLVVAPYWFPQLITPNGKGAIIGFDGTHTRAHVLRALLEGVAFGLYPGLERFERDSGQRFVQLAIGGGGSQNDVAMQITADIFGLPAIRPHTLEICALGAAMDAAVAVGIYSGFEQAVTGMTHEERVFEPVAENHELYTRIYQDVYCKLYDSLEVVFVNLKQITGR